MAILTGFPCNMEFEIPTETDGPPGAFSIARIFLKLNPENKVYFLSDDCNHKVLKSGVDLL